MASVTLGGTTVVTEAEGGWDSYAAPLQKRLRSFVHFPLSESEVVKELGLGGGEGSLRIRFHNVLTAGIDALVARVEGLRDAASGTLAVPGWPNVTHVVVADVSAPVQIRQVSGIAASGAGTACYRLEFTLSLRKLR